MINITIPKADVSITKQINPQLSNIYGFTDFHLIPRDYGGIFMFYNDQDELLFVGKARKLRPRIKNILKTPYLTSSNIGTRSPELMCV